MGFWRFEKELVLRRDREEGFGVSGWMTRQFYYGLGMVRAWLTIFLNGCAEARRGDTTRPRDTASP